ncbi:unnamed protein product [Sympodiomycopsis kandeliae]
MKDKHQNRTSPIGQTPASDPSDVLPSIYTRTLRGCIYIRSSSSAQIYLQDLVLSSSDEDVVRKGQHWASLGRGKNLQGIRRRATCFISISSLLAIES